MSQPVQAGERVDSIDVLRGVAILGILLMNVQSFSMPDSAYMNPTNYGDFSGAQYLIWFWTHLLADMKFITIFSLLFGAGIVLFTSRKEAQGESSLAFHYRRSVWLAVFGLLHAYLLWSGDVLFWYGVTAMWVFPMRKFAPRRLIVIGAILILLGSLASLTFGLSMPHWPEESLEEFNSESWSPPPEKVQEELDAARGTYWEAFTHRAPNSFLAQTFIYIVWAVWRVGGVMLIGMAFFKLGVISAQRSRRFYVTMIAAAVLIGAPLILLGVHQNDAHDWHVLYSFFLGSQFNYWGSLFMAGGWIGLVMLVCRSAVLQRYTRPLAAAGRMAFSNYIGQTLIGTFIFYGWGMGYFGYIGRGTMLAIVFVVWALQLIISPLWLRSFRFGPLEWLWRSLTYKSPQPMLRRAHDGA